MENLGRLNGDGFTLAVDSAILSSTSSDLETCPLQSFASVVDSAIKSDTPEAMSDTMGDFEDFQLFTEPRLENNIGGVHSWGQSSFPNFVNKTFRVFSKSNHTQTNVTVNGQPISYCVIKKAEKLAGPIHPGNYWYDFRAGFWGVMGGPCLGIIPPFIEEFNYPLPYKCSGGNTCVFVNDRELHQKDLNLLSARGLPTDGDRSYIIDISGRVLDEDTREELYSLGRLAPTMEKAKRGFGMRVPTAAT